MPKTFEIYADEAWTHSTPPPNRYWCFFGGIMGRSTDLDRLDTALRAVMTNHGIKGEAKWNKLSATNLSCYKDLVGVLVSHLKQNNIKYRQMFVDRSYVWNPPPCEPKPTELEREIPTSADLRHLNGRSGVSRK
jgi:hypothetical protein